MDYHLNRIKTLLKYLKYLLCSDWQKLFQHLKESLFNTRLLDGQKRPLLSETLLWRSENYTQPRFNVMPHACYDQYHVLVFLFLMLTLYLHIAAQQLELRWPLQV